MYSAAKRTAEHLPRSQAVFCDLADDDITLEMRKQAKGVIFALYVVSCVHPAPPLVLLRSMHAVGGVVVQHQAEVVTACSGEQWHVDFYCVVPSCSVAHEEHLCDERYSTSISTSEVRRKKRERRRLT